MIAFTFPSKHTIKGRYSFSSEEVQLHQQRIQHHYQEWKSFEEMLYSKYYKSVRDVDADGDCFFYCASLHLFGCLCHSRYLRALVSSYLSSDDRLEICAKEMAGGNDHISIYNI